MAWRKGHGNGKGVPRVETLPADELPRGVAAPTGKRAKRGADGRFTKGDDGLRELGRRGAIAKQESMRLRKLLGLVELPDGHPYQPYHRLARQWRDDHVADLAAHVGGGVVGPGVQSVVSTAALQLAASRYLNDLGAEKGDAKLLLDASRLADSSRQNLIAAHELAAKEGQARRSTSEPATPWLVPGTGKGSK